MKNEKMKKSSFESFTKKEIINSSQIKGGKKSDGLHPPYDPLRDGPRKKD